MSLERTSSALTAVQVYIQKEEIDGIIESFLVQHVAIIFYSEMEETVEIIIKEYFERCSTAAIGEFLRNNMRNILRRTSKSDISKLIKQFGNDVKDRFESEITDMTITKYSNIIQSRHATGHRQGSNITLREIEEGLESARLILRALDNCLC